MKAEAKDEKDAEPTDVAMHEMPASTGPSGLLHLPSAMTGPAGTFRVGMYLDWFKTSGFLCTEEYPCSKGGVRQANDEASHIGATALVSATIVDGLETYLGARVYANSNDQSSPKLLQVLGDITFGLKYVKALGEGVVNLGGGAEVLFLNGTGGIGLNGGGTSFRLRALSTFALDKTEAKTPLRIHFGLSYLFDNSAQVVTDVEADRTTRLGKRTDISRIERYGLGINRLDRFELGLGFEGLLVNDKLRPFLEYNMMIPVNRQGFECVQAKDIAGGGRTDECLGGDGVGFGSLPSKLTLGTRIYPFMGGMGGVSFLAAVDIGVTGTSKPIAELAPQAPYTVWLGFGLATDANDHPPKVVEKVVEKKVEVPVGIALVKVKGFVHEAGGNTPIANAIVSYVGAAGMAPLATAADGVFGDDVPAGTYQYSIKADGFKEGSCGGTAVPKGGTPAPTTPGKPPSTPGTLEIDCALEALPKVGSATLTVIDADVGTPLSGIPVEVADAGGGSLKSLTTDGNGQIKVTELAPGFWTVKINTEGYFQSKQPFEIRVREETKDKIAIRARPKDKLVEVGKTEIKIKQQVHFATDKSIILGDSTALLEEVADVLIANPRIKRLEIQGHTDNTGTKEHNQELSQARAEAVKQFLVSHGVEASRLEAKGYGQNKPIAPNINEAGKGKNRRVQFVITEQDPAPDAKKGK